MMYDFELGEALWSEALSPESLCRESLCLMFVYSRICMLVLASPGRMLPHTMTGGEAAKGDVHTDKQYHQHDRSHFGNTGECSVPGEVAKHITEYKHQAGN
jgi:hypothetical protein